VHFTVTVDDPLPSGTTEIRNVVTSTVGTCQVTEPECTATNPTGPELTATKKLVSIDGEAAGPGETVHPGDILTYAITVTNQGGTPATTTLTDHVPANTTYAGPATEGWGPTCVDAPPSAAGTACTQKVTVPAATAEGGPGSVTVHFTVTVDNPLPLGTTEIINVVLSSEAGFSTEGACQVPEPACTATNPTPSPVPPSPPPTVTMPTAPPPTAPPPHPPQPVVRGAASAHGPSECVVSNARVYVTGRQIKSVTFYLDGPKVKIVKRPDKKGRYLININAGKLRSGVHRVRIVVVFVPSSKTKSKTMYVLVDRCRPPRPLFTG
jgi:uncharacterized repeat protein (TIGR01451 family)